MTMKRVVRGWHVAALLCAATFASAQAPDSVRARPDSAPPPPATLVGKVTDSSGVGLPGAEITILKSDRVHAITGDSGDFRIAGIVPGTVVFSVRRIGFESATFTAVLRGGKVQRARFSLTATALELPTVAVSDTAVKTHWLDQFDRRRSNGARGTFITRAEIVKRGARTGVDVIRMVPGVRVSPSRNGMTNTVSMTRGSGGRPCFPTMFVHNMPYSGTMDDFIAEDIEAVEVYVGISEIPPELDKNGRGICAAIVVWTRDPRKAP
jgi:hypothetical protein